MTAVSSKEKMVRDGRIMLKLKEGEIREP